MTVPQHSPGQPAHRRLTRAAAATGLLIALTVPALAGTAHADGPRAEPQRAVAAATEPSAALSSPVKRAGQNRPSAAPSAPSTSGPKEPAATEPPSAAPKGVEPSAAPRAAEPSAAPSRSDGKELAHTGSSKVNMVMGVGAGALILAGAGTVFAVRRRHQH
ncbi:LPXTG cell wall anchor domain-containing protein [Streptomyces sp. NPDC059161]|uniref:LPXTG cell wall anchor domain-containing protein n=1 Tax=unclassified Streptomyces TaxID=2593676 RepID=UPI00365406D3